MIVFENRFRRGYRSARRIELDKRDRRRVLAVGLALCLVFGGGVRLLALVNAANLSAELVAISAGDLSQGALLCSDCHNEGGR